MKMNQEQAKQWGDHTYPPIHYGNAFNDPRPGAFIPLFTLVDEAREEQRQAEAKAAQAREEVRKAQQAEEKLYGDLFIRISIDSGFGTIGGSFSNHTYVYACKSCGTVVSDRRKHYEVHHPAQNNKMVAEARGVEAPKATLEPEPITTLCNRMYSSANLVRFFCDRPLGHLDNHTGPDKHGNRYRWSNVDSPVTAPSSTETAQKFNRALLDDPEFQADLRALFTSITYFSSQRSKGLFFAEFVDKWLARTPFPSPELQAHIKNASDKKSAS